MRDFTSSNPAFRESTLKKVPIRFLEQSMTVSGIAGKTLLLFLLLVISAVIPFTQAFQAALTPKMLMVLLAADLIAGFLATLVPRYSAVFSPLYSVVEGILVGSVSYVFENVYNGIILQAVLLTGGVFCVMLLFYRLGILRPTRRFAAGIFAAMCGILLTYLVEMALSLFGVNIGFLTGNGIVSIGISLFVVIVASLSFILDFGNIQVMTNAQMPKYMEWYAGFGLMVTFVWLYLEILSLLAKLQSRN